MEHNFIDVITANTRYAALGCKVQEALAPTDENYRGFYESAGLTRKVRLLMPVFQQTNRSWYAVPKSKRFVGFKATEVCDEAELNKHLAILNDILDTVHDLVAAVDAKTAN